MVSDHGVGSEQGGTSWAAEPATGALLATLAGPLLPRLQSVQARRMRHVDYPCLWRGYRAAM